MLEKAVLFSFFHAERASALFDLISRLCKAPSFLQPFFSRKKMICKAVLWRIKVAPIITVLWQFQTSSKYEDSPFVCITLDTLDFAIAGAGAPSGERKDQ